MSAHKILNDPFLNKGTAFTMEERKELGLIGLLPPYVQTIKEQAAQTYAQLQTKSSDLEKRLFLMEIFNTNRRLFYYLFSQHLEEFNPIVYDPTIAETIEGYSNFFVDPQYAGYLDINHPEYIPFSRQIYHTIKFLSKIIIEIFSYNSLCLFYRQRNLVFTKIFNLLYLYNCLMIIPACRNNN